MLHAVHDVQVVCQLRPQLKLYTKHVAPTVEREHALNEQSYPSKQVGLQHKHILGNQPPEHAELSKTSVHGGGERH